jgi:hypothetical protein
MGFYLRRMLGNDIDSLSREEIEDAAEGALSMQHQLAQDVLSHAETSTIPERHLKTDQRIVRAADTLARLT